MDDNVVRTFVEDVIFQKIVHFLSVEKNINVSFFKENYLKRRIYFRAISLKFNDIESYWRYLMKNEEEVNKFRDLLTVNVTSFFRNPEVFNTITSDILPALFRKKCECKEKFIKILSIGCATGEEPYSIAMILKEYFAEEIETVKPYILGIDFDNASINYARTGVYEAQKISAVPEVLKKKYFDIIDNRYYKLSSDIMKMVIFREGDVFMKDIKMLWDVIFCRNVLIYINSQAQEKLLQKIISACRVEGYLILGKSEGLIGKLRSFFIPKYPRERIYLKRRVYES